MEKMISFIIICGDRLFITGDIGALKVFSIHDDKLIKDFGNIHLNIV